MTWADSYRGYDDAALALVANPGLVRRAAKLAPEASWVDSADDHGVVRVGEFDVRLDGRGPSQARCPCPVAGVCVHALAAAMFVRDGRTESGSDKVEQSDEAPTAVDSADGTDGEAHERAAGSSALAEVLALTPSVLCKRAGIAAARAAYARITASPDVPLTMTGDEHRLDLDWGAGLVRYVAGAGWDGMVAAADDRSATCLEALARVFAANGVAWDWPEKASQQPDAPAVGPIEATRAVTDAVRGEITATLAAGLAHLGEDACDRLAELALDARLAGLPLLSRLLQVASGSLEALVRRADDVSESEPTSALARVWALTVALDRADPEVWAKLRGTSRRTFSADEAPEALTLRPLGATWWTSPSGARGLTLTVWDGDDVRQVTTARPAGLDPSFVRSPNTTGLWGAALSTLLSGPFRLDGPRVSADGAVSPTTGTVTGLRGGFSESALLALADKLRPAPTGIGFTDVDRPVALLAASGFGKLVIDEPQQQLVWTLPTPSGEVELRQEIAPALVHRVDALLALEAGRARLVAVLARRAVIRGTSVWEPATLFVRRHEGLALVALDFAPTTARTGLRSVLQKRWDLLLRRLRDQSATVPQAPRSPIVHLCDDLRDLVVDLAATGRPTLSSAQRSTCAQLATRCDDLALVTLANSVRTLAGDPSPPTLLRLQLLADRVAAAAVS